MIKDPIILEGPGFDWERGEEVSKHVINSEGNVNWKAASMADPGVMKCPSCGIYLWWEGDKVKCPDCGHIWRPK